MRPTGLGAAYQSTRPRAENGAVAVEFALILPVLAMLMLGIVTFGLAYSDHLALTNTVREGARFGATTADSGTWASSVRARTHDLYGNEDNPLPEANICAQLIKKTSATQFIVRQQSDTNCNDGKTAAGKPPTNPTSITVGSCFVKVWAELPATLSWILGAAEVKLRAHSVTAYDRKLLCT